MQRLATALLVLVVAGATLATAGVAATAVSEPVRAPGPVEAGDGDYAGSHVSFDADARAVTDYAVGGETMLDAVTVASERRIADDGPADPGGSLSAVTRIEGSALAFEGHSTTEARLASESGATITAHDNPRGILMIAAGNGSEYAVADLPAGANASAESDSVVHVTTDDGTRGTFLAVGDANLTVNDDGDVSASLGDDGRLAFRAYPDGKDESDEVRERLVAEGTATVETYVTVEDGDTVVDAVSYDDGTEVATDRTAAGTVEVTVDRATHEGTILLASVSEAVVSDAADLEVTVDGEAATKAATHTQLESAIGSDQSRYAVERGGDGGADVLVAVNHFSERTVAMSPSNVDATPTESGGEDETTGSDGESTGGTTDSPENPPGSTDDGSEQDDGDREQDDTDDGQNDGRSGGDGIGRDDDGRDDNDGGVPGFTVLTGVVAVVAAAILARLR